jgi:deazaflavin-dependent oxidoreductase (nitroreductase family)
MGKAVIRVSAAMLCAVVVFGVAFVAGMRAKSPKVRKGVRRLARATQGLTIRSAGEPGAYASIVKHVGRTSGRNYVTPVRAAPTDDGFAITLPYGATTDWLKNVLAAGAATIVCDGLETEVARPEVVDSSVARRYFLVKDQRTQRLFGVDEYLVLHRVAS